MANRVLSFHYVLTNAQGKTLDSSRDANPLQVLEGREQIIPGLEIELFKMKTGDKKKVNVQAAQAYGPVRDDLRVKLNRSKLPSGDIQPGSQFSSNTEGHGPVFTVIKIENDEVHLDGNHPLAGMDLHFDVEVMELREATEEELSHGHAHGPDGHHHH